MLGVVGFAYQIPSLFLSPVAGVLIDRWRRRRLLLVTQALAMGQAFALAALSCSGRITIWNVLALGLFMGCINAVDAPARQAFLPDIVENKEVLGNALSLNSMMFNSICLFAPLLAGLLIAKVGEGPCFLMNGISFMAVLASLALIRVRSQPIHATEIYLWRELKEGVHYACDFRPIRSVLLLLSVANLMGFSFVVLMPVFAKTVLGGGPSTLGMLMAAIGLGALAATLLMAGRRDTIRLGPVSPASACLFALALMIFSLSHVLWLSLVTLAGVGFAVIAHMLVGSTLLQTLSADDKRGRVMSFYTVAIEGLAPLGCLLAGWLADTAGPTAALMIGGVSCIAGALLLAPDFLPSNAFKRTLPDESMDVPILGVNRCER